MIEKPKKVVFVAVGGYLVLAVAIMNCILQEV